MAEVYSTGGDACFEVARDYLVARLDALKAAMIGDNPLISFVYDRHNVADLRLIAASVAMVSPIGSVANYSRPSSQGIVDWELVFSVRVHTAYEGGIADDQKIARLLNSVANILLTKKALSTSPYYVIEAISEVKNAVTFPESRTIGGELMLQMKHFTQYTQES